MTCWAARLNSFQQLLQEQGRSRDQHSADDVPAISGLGKGAAPGAPLPAPEVALDLGPLGNFLMARCCR